MRRRNRAGAPGAMERFSEPFPPHGALAAEGAENLLGRPRLDPLVVLVREAVQNSWDARQDDTSQVEFSVQGVHPQREQCRQLRTRVFSDPPKAAGRLREVLARDDILLLSLTDTGTSGLGGPIRADRPPGKHEPSNFVDLMFNIGQPAERAFGGGTYGFGRTISYVVSEARAVLVHSRTRAGRRLESRFIAAAFSDHFTQGNQRFTGRHWWGRPATGSIEPVVGDEADALALSLGLPSFASNDTGTTICVVAPDLRGRTPEQAFRFMAGALTWNFWPKMIERVDTGRPMKFSVSIDGRNLAVPEPDDLPPLHAFASSLRAVRDAERGATRPSAGDNVPETRVEEVVLPKTGQRIGWLGLTRCPVVARPTRDEGEDDEDERGPSASFVGPAHHVALLRRPELVVEYLSTAELTSVSSEYAGVFKPVAEVDRAFARAEPPTHDAWHSNLVPETKLRRFVGVALRTVRDTTTRYAEQPSTSEGAVSAARIARALGSLFGGAEDADRQQPRVEGQPPFVTVDDVNLLEAGEYQISEIVFSVDHAEDAVGTIVDAVAHVATHDGWTIDRAGAGATTVDVVGFFDEDRELREAGQSLVVPRESPRRWRVRVRSSPGVSVGVDLVPRTLDEVVG